jgi:hypothetical protein
MSDPAQPTPLPDEPQKRRKPLPKIIWLFVAFLPSTLALIFIQIPKAWPWMLLLLLLLNTFCSAMASDGLTQGMKNKDERGGLMFFLIVFFFAANAGISFFIGCAATIRL